MALYALEYLSSKVLAAEYKTVLPDVESIAKAINAANQYLKINAKALQIEIEVRNLSELSAVLLTGNVDRIMLDNFIPEKIKEAIDLISEHFETEASGGINLENIQEYAKTGVDFVSVGALIHQAKSLDLSLKAVIV